MSFVAEALDDLDDEFERPAVVHDWLTHPGGSEKVVLEMLGLLPRAEVYTSVYDPSVWDEALRGHVVHASFLDRLPGARRHYKHLLPLMNAAFESFDLADHDLVISSSHSSAKNVLTGPDTLHVCYCHTPMRYAWEPRFLEGEALGMAGALAARALMPALRRRDLTAATRPDVFVANSRHVAARVAKYYRRDAEVIAPPIDVERHLQRPRQPNGYYLVLGRVVPYKRVDLAVAACERLGRPLKVAGSGRALEALEGTVGPATELLGYVADADLDDLLSGARALIFPGLEDFGIVPVEAQAAGVPVIAYGRGGILDTVVDGTTGVFFADQTVDALADAILRFESLSFDEEEIRENARRFGAQRFRQELADLVRRCHAAPLGAAPPALA